MKKIFALGLLIISTPVPASVGTVILANVCGDNIIIQVDNAFIAASHYSGTQFKVGDQARAAFSSPATRYLATDGVLQGQYYIYVPEMTIEGAKRHICPNFNFGL